VIRNVEAYYTISKIHDVTMGNPQRFEESFGCFLLQNVGIERQASQQLFNYVEKPNKGGATFGQKSHRRFQENVERSLESILNKLKTRDLGNHNAYKTNVPSISMGEDSTFIRGLIGKHTSRGQPFLGFQKSPFGNDPR
jgi:hypothetical protein